jgi:methylamine dehydrogenase heavy chain
MMHMKKLIAILISIHFTGIAMSQTDPSLPPLEPETIGIIESLPAEYPDHWIFAHDGTFFHMVEGRMVLLDPLAETIGEQHKGLANVFFMGNFAQATTRPEIYTTNIFYSRGHRGQRTDVLNIIDKRTLNVIDEVILPGDKSFRGMPERYAVTLIDNERLLLSFNLSPATSVTVIDIANRAILNEVGTPGCAMIYPTGQRGFSSMCSDGGMLSTQLDANGQVTSQTRVEPFFNTDNTPVYERPAIIDGIGYFPSIAGLIHPIDLTGDVASVGDAWPLVADQAERDANWRPGGIGLIDHDKAGNLYILMHPDGKEGSYQGGGPEVWVFDPVQGERLQRITLQSWAISLAVTKSDTPYLVVTNGDLNLEVYNAETSEYIRTLTDLGMETPLMLHGVK